MLTQAEMPVVFVLDEIISQGNHAFMVNGRENTYVRLDRV